MSKDKLATPTVPHCDKMVDDEHVAAGNSKQNSIFNTNWAFLMPFGLTNAPATFQRLMECVLAGLSPSQCLIYLDDIIVFSVTFTQHLERLGSVLQQLRDAGLQLKAEKCAFANVVSAAGVRPDLSKIEAVSNFPVPQEFHQLRKFLGLANYDRRFVKSYSEIAEPLHQLTRKTTMGYLWTSECQDAFEELKRRLITPPILVAISPIY